MSVRRLLCSVTIVLTALISLTACSTAGPTAPPSTNTAAPAPTSTAPSPAAAPAQDCTADRPEDWQTTPANMAQDVIARELGVSVERIEYGRFGGATCPVPIKASTLGTRDPVVVAVPGQGSPCSVIGLQKEEDFRAMQRDPNTTATSVLVICATAQATTQGLEPAPASPTT